MYDESTETYPPMLGGFFDDLLRAGERVATAVIQRPQPVYTSPTFPTGMYSTASQAPGISTTTVLTLGALGLGLYLLLGRRR
jgi:uncharacterized protein (TIGR03382 family)